MLFRYRLFSDEFEGLKEILRQTCANRPLAAIAASNLYFPAGFVMFGAEWWKREYRGGVWSWPLITQAFGADPDSWLPTQRTAAVLSGLKHWGHTIHRSGRAYLGSVITQGGIPQVLLSEGHGNITGLLISAGRRASRLNARGDDIIGIVRDYQDRLQQSLQREEIIELIARTIDAVLDLQREFGLKGSAEECIQRLDSIAPDWKDRFPLPLENAATATLLRRLIGEVIESRQDGGTFQFTVERYLRLSERHYQLTSKLVLPSKISGQQLANFLHVPEDLLPRHLQIGIETTRRELISDARKLLGASPDAFSLAPPRKYWSAQDAAAEHLLYADLRKSAVPSLPLAGGAELETELPWVFSDEDGLARLVGVGSQRVRSASALICYPDHWTVAPTEGTSFESVDSLALGNTNRLIARVTGECWINGSDDARYRVRTGQAVAESTQYVWQGQRIGFPSNPRQVFLGLPRLSCHTPDGDRLIAKSDIEWRRAGSKQVIGSDFQVSGPVDATLRVDGETVFRSRMVVLDRTAKIVFHSGKTAAEGVIDFQGDWGIQSLAMASSAANATVSALPNGWQVTLAAPTISPETLTLALDWERSIVPLCLTLPFPVSGGRFFNNSGEEIKSGDYITPRELIGSRLRILDSNPNRPMNYGIQPSLIVGRKELMRGEMQLILLAGSSAEVRLFDYQPAIASLLSTSDALDAIVELILWVGTQPRQKILVKRFDCVLEPESNGVALSQADLQRLSASALKGIKVLGTRLDNFSRSAVEFIPVESEGVPSGRWFPRTMVTDSKALFVYPAPDSCLQFRPMILPGHSPDTPPTASTEGLSAAVLLPTPEERRNAFDASLTAMAADFQHPDWKLAESIWRCLGHLPLSSLDFWRRLIVHPDALVAFALRSWDDPPAEPATHCHRLTEELGLIWEGLPVSAWRRGFRGLCRYWQDVLDAENAKRVLPLDVASKLAAIKEFCPALDFLLDLLAWEVTNQKSSEHQKLRNLRKQYGESQLCQLAYKALWSGEDSHLQQVLLHQHLDTEWPDGLLERVFNELLRNNATKASLAKHCQQLLHLDVDPKTKKIDRKDSVANVPVLLAFTLATETLPNWWLEPENRSTLKRHKDFDPEWFTIAFAHGIRMCYALNLLKFEPVSQQ